MINWSPKKSYVWSLNSSVEISKNEYKFENKLPLKIFYTSSIYLKRKTIYCRHNSIILVIRTWPVDIVAVFSLHSFPTTCINENNFLTNPTDHQMKDGASNDKMNRTWVPSMIHSARLTILPVAITILTWKLFCFARFDGRTDTTCENVGRPRGSISFPQF